MLDTQTCSRARLARDARFDGKFFIGVRSTKIYCRSICPVPTVKEKNVRYFPTAAAAVECGFRPCLRCRPECSPGTPAWIGTSTTVSRALRLIIANGLDEGGMEQLAERVGVGSRHLRRLFLRHLGAPPRTIVQTRRLHFAKKLIDETDLSMTEVALAAGFGCVRRFNDAIRNTYDRTPSQIRRLAHQKTSQPQNHYLFHLRFRPPFDWESQLQYLAERAVPGVEVVGQSYSRAISVQGHSGLIEVECERGNNELAVRVQIADPSTLFPIIERIRRMFDLDADWNAIARVFSSDADLASRIKQRPGIRITGCWDGFELAVRAILGEQTNPAKASVIAGRITDAFGEEISRIEGISRVFPSAPVLAKADLRPFGVTEKRANAIRSLARAVCASQMDFNNVADSVAFLRELRSLTGIDAVTADYIAMRALGEPDAFPIAPEDCRALKVRDARELASRAEAWRPWRSYAAMYLADHDALPKPHRAASAAN